MVRTFLRLILVSALTFVVGCAAETDEAVAEDAAELGEAAWQDPIADYAGTLRRPDGRVDVPAMIAKLTSLHVNTYAFLVWGWRYQAKPYYDTDFEDLALFLPAAAAAGIDVWAYLPSPQEFEKFAPPPCKADFLCWGTKIGRLAQSNPNLKAIVIDDFFSKANAVKLTRPYAAQMRKNARAEAPWLRLLTIAYFTNTMSGLLGRNYEGVLDGLVFVDQNRTIAASEKFFADQIAQLHRVVRAPVEALDFHVPPSAGAQPGEQASLSREVTRRSGPFTISFGVGDDLFAKGPTTPAVQGGNGARMLQLLVNGNKVWERDLNAAPDAALTPGFQRFTVDLSPRITRANHLITFRVIAPRAATGMPDIDAYVYGIDFGAGLEPSSDGWTKNVIGGGGWSADRVTRSYKGMRVVQMVYAGTLANGWTPDKEYIVHNVKRARERTAQGLLDGVITYQLDKINTFPGSTFDEVSKVYATP